jgi:hypothetical protein
MIDKIRKIFYSSWIGGLYFEFLLWWDRRKQERDLAYRSPSNKVVYNATKESYRLGVTRIKARIREMSKDSSKASLEAVLAEAPELLDYAVNNDPNGHAEALKLYVRKDKDIKSNTDKALMIDQRIQDYKELHKHIEARQKLREQRKKGKTNE